jgi:hypothetical protein
MSIKTNGTYDKVYLLFRTNKTLLSEKSTQHISGYYDVNLDKVEIDPNYEEPVLYAKKAHFVDFKEAIDLSGFLTRFPNPRFPFSSETGDGKHKEYLEQLKKKISLARNRFDQYVEITKKLDKLFKYYEFEEGIYDVCENCSSIDKCLLIKRINKKGKLFHQLPVDIAIKINKHFKKC